MKCNVDNLCTGEEWGFWEDVVLEDITEDKTDDSNTSSKDLKTGVSSIIICILLSYI